MQTDVSVLTKPPFARERRRDPRFVIDLPLEYRKVGEANSRGAYTGDVSRMGLLIYSVDNILVGTELEVGVFYADECRLDIFKLLARIVRKQAHSEPEWKGYKYGLEFVQISGEDRRKLDTVIGQRVASDEIGSKELHTILNSGPSRPFVILSQRRIGERGFKETLIQLLERYFECVVFAIILLAILIGA